MIDVIGSSIISKKGPNNVVMHKASFHDDRLDTEQSKKADAMIKNRENNKLVNIVYNDGEYYVYEPQNADSNKYNIIDNHLWLITKFMP